LETVKVAHPVFESLALFWVAQDQGFFNRNGLNVTSQKYDTGAGALNGMINGEADIAIGTAELPLVTKALHNEKIQIISCVDKLDFIYLVARKDRGIASVSDLAGKRVGTTVGTVAEFYLGRLLILNGLSVDNITLVDVQTPLEWVNAVTNGTIDAVVTAQPYANLAKEILGENAFVWAAQNSQPQYALIISKTDWIISNPEHVKKFLGSLLQAEEFVLSNPQEAKSIVKNEMNFTDEYVETVWKQNQYGLSLDQALLVAMEDESRWMISNNLTNATVVPNFLEFIYFEGLKFTKPDSVNIIR
jgi:NitT/TauT family transport system substrate-binding protein